MNLRAARLVLVLAVLIAGGVGCPRVPAPAEPPLEPKTGEKPDTPAPPPIERPTPPESEGAVPEFPPPVKP